MSGCPLNVGDLIATGTASGPSVMERGCLLEHTEPLNLGDGCASPASLRVQWANTVTAKRTFLEDGDEVIFEMTCGQQGSGVGLGVCKGVVLTAK